ncbi:receptor-like protein EIX1 [Abrus precatorius]|uniref:Receptor-like protein EIX1 n=1 Tax=Abrus precatorius TaxID=3816 RepID=A0A8B8LTS4_ABRPR|nr:receptor-like protein EIX1 [Abrus precatorius]
MSWVLNVSKVVTHLDLSYNSLQHSIPDGFANMISHLQYLHLSFNELDELLDLSSNPFSRGSLPDFSSLSSLNTLSLANTNIVGELSFGHLPDHLEALDLSFNQLSGSMPSFDVGKLASLQELDLSNNQLNGTLPINIGQLSNLVRLSITSNKLNGVINESHLSNLSKLEYLQVSQNSLSFDFSSNWVPPFQLTYLYTTSCILGPKFPAWIKHQRELTALQISNSGISDSFPEWFWNLSLSLLYLNVSHNQLIGTLSKSLLHMKTRPWSVWDLRSIFPLSIK